MQELAERLRKVGTGLGLIYAAICLMFIALIGGACGGGIAAAGMGNQAAKQFQQVPQRPGAFGQNPNAAKDAADAVALAGGPVVIVVALAGIAVFIAYILDLIGRILCLNVPPECQGANYLHISLVLVALGIVYSVWSVLNSFGVAPTPPGAVTAIMALAGLVAQILFMIFLRLLSEYIHRDDLADRARQILTWAIIVGVVYLVSAIVMLAGAFGGAGPIALVGSFALLGSAILALILIIRYANLLQQMKIALHDYAQALNESGYEGGPETAL